MPKQILKLRYAHRSFVRRIDVYTPPQFLAQALCKHLFEHTTEKVSNGC